MNFPRRWLPLALAAGIAFYIGLYLWGMHSEGYQFLNQAVRKSTEIQRRVGSVQSVRISFMGGYRERFVDSDRRVTMSLNVVGDKGSVTIDAAAKKANGVWSVSKASINGQPVEMN